MKKLLFAVLTIAAFTFASNDAQKSFSTVNQVEGLYIFVESKPNEEFEYLGTVSVMPEDFGTDVLGNGGLCLCEAPYKKVRNGLIKKAKKKFKEGTALIIDVESNKADVIKFKE